MEFSKTFNFSDKIHYFLLESSTNIFIYKALRFSTKPPFPYFFQRFFISDST